MPGWSIFSSIMLLASLIFFHEVGHFLVAKWMGVSVSVFSLGFGPRLAGFSWNETDVRLSLVPLGGYVKVDQDLEHGETTNLDKTNIKFSWKYLLFYAGGIIANIVIAVLILFSLHLNQSLKIAVPSSLVLKEVIYGTPADKAGLKSMDRLCSIDSLNFPSNRHEEAISYIRSKPNQVVSMTIERQGVVHNIKVTLNEEAGMGRLGAIFEPNNLTYYGSLKFNNIVKSMQLAISDTFTIGCGILKGFGKLIKGEVAIKDIGGPISIIKVSSQAAQNGLINFFFFAALLSINLALVNALPIPLLDGGYITMFLFERIYGKQIPTITKERIFTIGFIIVMSLMTVVIISDIMIFFR